MKRSDIIFQHAADGGATGGPERPRPEHPAQIASAVRAACLQAARDGYDQARMSGLCHEGAWELALDRIATLDLAAVLAQPPSIPKKESER